MLRVDPRQRQRLIEIIRNLAERIGEAKDNGWHGEVEGLTISLTAAEKKLVGLDRAVRNHPGSTSLGLPGLRTGPSQSRVLPSAGAADDTSERDPAGACMPMSTGS